MFSFLRRKKSAVVVTSTLSEQLLTDASPRLTPPTCVKFPLWKHQEAMLQRCVDIEKYSDKKLTMLPTNHLRYDQKSRPQPIEINVGIMNDPPGCGKTFVALSLMARDPNSTNIVIVPSNIHKQWIDAIKMFFADDKFTYAAITEYKDTLDMNKKIKQANCIITTTLYCELVVSELAQPSNIKRVFVDEIDTVGDKRIASIPACDIVWFMSASFNPVVDRTIGPFALTDLSEGEIMQRMCKCDISFMQECQPKLLEPRHRMITVPDGDLVVIKDLIDNYALALLNSLNIKKAKHRVLNRMYECAVNNSVDLANVKVKELTLEIDQLHQDIKDIDANDDNPNYLKDILKAEAAKNIEEKENIIDSLKTNITGYKPLPGTRTKIEEFQSICEEIAAKPTTQWLFFSDDEHIFDILIPILKANNITYTSLDQGTQEKNDVELRRYKSSEVTVLLVNSIQDGVGLNLENTTHIVFLHNTNPKMIDQVVCRAQRPGRTNQLEIICIYHENELQ